jgi:predicted metal-binding membrane protein
VEQGGNVRSFPLGRIAAAALLQGVQGRKHTARRSLLLGQHQGLCYVGSCWALMLLMFASEASNLGWMVALGIVMLAEKRLA